MFLLPLKNNEVLSVFLRFHLQHSSPPTRHTDINANPRGPLLRLVDSEEKQHYKTITVPRTIQREAMTGGASTEEQDPLLTTTTTTAKVRSSSDANRRGRRHASVVATSIKNPSPAVMPTVHALLESSNHDQIEQGMVFLRRVFALLVLQYGTILFVASPFAMIGTFQQHVAHPYHNTLEAVAVTGIVGSLLLALCKGATYPYARVALVCLTLSVALELGLSFAEASWGRYGLIAVGQATTSFAVILALFQFDSKSLEWLTYPAAAMVCLLLSGIWMAVLVESGLRPTLALAVGLGSWAFAIVNLLSCKQITKHVASNEIVLATLFILVPEALVFLQSKKRHPAAEKEEDEGGGIATSTSTAAAAAQQRNYGGV